MTHLARLLAATLVALLFDARSVAAQEHAHGGTGRAESIGTVHFPTTCAPGVAPRMDRAMALLHSFEFGATLKALDDVLASDSTCAMAYWGIALARWGNPMAAGNRAPALLAQGRSAASAGERLASHASARERGYIRAVSRLYDDYEHTDQRARQTAYERAMAELVAAQPADTEARIFHAIALVATALPTDKTYAKQIEAGEILEALWAKQPNHPGLAHYIIHAYDVPALAPRARVAAQRYAAIAPSAAHALHMPSHTFTRVGMWRASADANARSMQVASRTASIAEVLHAADYAMYADLQLGRWRAAKTILDSLPALASRFDPTAVTGAAPGSAGIFALAAIPARWALERRAWAEAAAITPASTTVPYADAMSWFARALGAAHTGDTARARVAIDSLNAIQQRLAAHAEPYWAEQVAIQSLGAQAWRARAEHRDSVALATMREAARREDATDKSAVSPGPLAPARELLADMLVALGRPTEAQAEYRTTLVREPGRRHAVEGLATVVRQ
ncbi:MAG: hypothetical protein JF589_14320 [Gemmatimonadetes bacterium]|nr:hypothetical protein [Gemmatimonadota bacterium]